MGPVPLPGTKHCTSSKLPRQQNPAEIPFLLYPHMPQRSKPLLGIPAKPARGEGRRHRPVGVSGYILGQGQELPWRLIRSSQRFKIAIPAVGRDQGGEGEQRERDGTPPPPSAHARLGPFALPKKREKREAAPAGRSNEIK